MGSQSVELEEIGKKARNFDYRKDDSTTYDIPVMLWILLVLLLILIIGPIIMRTKWMMLSYIILNGSERSYVFKWGWKEFELVWKLDKNSKINVMDGNGLYLPMHYSSKVLNDFSRLFVIGFVCMLMGMIIIFIALFVRCFSKKGYYCYVWKTLIKIPQRPVIYFGMECIYTFIIFIALMLGILFIYITVELIPYSRDVCTSNGTENCTVFTIPFIGFGIYIMITCIINYFIFGYIARLNVKLNYGSMRVYYPENFNLVRYNDQGIYLYHLLKGINTCKYLVLFMLFTYSLQSSSMITVIVSRKYLNKFVRNTWFQPHGLYNPQYNPFDSAKTFINAGTYIDIFTHNPHIIKPSNVHTCTQTNIYR